MSKSFGLNVGDAVSRCAKRNAKMLNQQVYKSGIVINRLTGARFQRWDAIN